MMGLEDDAFAGHHTGSHPLAWITVSGFESLCVFPGVF